MTENQHVRVHSRCGACGFRFDPGDPFYAFCQGAAPAFGKSDYPNSGYCDNNHNHPWTFCRIPDCRYCHSSPDSGTVHTHCLKLFLSKFKEGGHPRLQWLWLAATWRSPWQGALPLDVEPSVGYRNPNGILDDLPRMPSLPPELRLKIWEFCASSPLQLYTAVSDLRDEMASSKQRKWSSIPLIEIKSWARSCQLECDDTPDNPIIRLTFDSRGLRRIERLSKPQSRSSSGSDFNAFVVEAAERFSGVLVEFQLGLARLQLPTGEANGFHIWDTPCPPPLKRCFSDLSNLPPPCHLGTVQLRACTGITFFMSSGSTYAVHAHTSNRLSAQSTFEALPTAQRKIVSWVYVPIEGGITKFGFSQVRKRPGNVTRSQSFLLSTESAGNIFIGRHRTSFSVIKQPLTLIHDKPDGLPISFVGAYSEDEGHRLQDTNLSHERSPSTAITPSFSSASLERASRIQIFYISETAICRGIIIQYEDGLRRALGQCRLGIDPVQEFAMPTHLCFSNATFRQPRMDEELRGVSVVSTTAKRIHDHKGPCWTCCEMTGFLNFYFENGATKLEHVIGDK
ncbi:Uncharacterized protein TPAR_07376 [Tolypocladium paradoxum]|uniref:Uncharacterized protein n=1 Tax=Tolypocladium paradoxum TaxID=94208 RepID=A0A2S4KQE5_9HYPO|nr:Uncharacterized protein TPAR_07376 [Tolypocladium paradoxum]